MLMKGQEVTLTVAWGLAGGVRVWIGDGKGAQNGELRLQWKVLRFFSWVIWFSAPEADQGANRRWARHLSRFDAS